METITTYSERRMGARRQFSLYPHEVLVTGGTVSGAHFETRISLASLESTVSRRFVRSEFFLVGVCLAGGCTFACLLLASLSPVVSWSYWPVLCIIVMGIVGFVVIGRTFRLVEFAQFRNQAGVTVLDVARSGPERHKFEGFIDALVRQIQITRGAA